MMPCEGRVTGSHEERVFATNPSGQGSILLEDATPVRPLFQSIFNLVNFGAATADDKTQDELELGNEIETEEAEKFFNTSSAEFVYNAENEE